MKTKRSNAIFLLFLILTAAALADSGPSLIQKSGVTGGLVVHLNMSQDSPAGQLTGALWLGKRYVVHGIDTDASAIEGARKLLRSKGLYGRVSVDQFDGVHLPYAANVVNLIIAKSLGTVPIDEVLRVLQPNGVALIGSKKITKPRPKETDEWTHFLHGPDNNAVAADSVVGPPRHMQWLADPMWLRHHGILASVQAPVSASGKLFFIMDKVWQGFTMNSPEWCISARDAYNGKVLWNKEIASWADFRRGFRSGPVQLQRTLVAKGKHVYAILAMDGPISILNSDTGELVRAIEQSGKTEEFIVHKKLVLAIVTDYERTEQSFEAKLYRSPVPPEVAKSKAIKAFDADTGRCLWRWPKSGTTDILPSTLAASGNSVYCVQGANAICLDRASGRVRWQTRTTPFDPSKNRRGPHGADRRIGWSVSTLVVAGDVVLYSNGQVITALAAADGKTMWQSSAKPTFLASGVDILVHNKQVWLGEMFTQSLDLKTGKVVRDNDLRDSLLTSSHHHRCYRDKGTSRFIIMSKRGAEFIDMAGDHHSRNNWIRGLCQYGMLPCNGLLYVPPHQCGCYKEAKLFGFWALAPERTLSRIPDSKRLIKGPAFGMTKAEELPQGAWPMYRRDELRSGALEQGLGSRLTPEWSAAIGSNLTAPVVAGDRIVVADMDRHEVIAVSAQTGKKVWSYTTGGRIDSPPTLHSGLVLCGSTDGKVYCLRATDGERVWTFNAALGHERTLVREQLESLWPVSGSVLVKDGICYFVAGRSSYLDGGLRLYALDPFSGEVVHQAAMASKHAGVTKRPTLPKGFKGDYKTTYAPDKSDAFYMEGNIADILVSDGESIYLRHIKYNRALVRQEGFGAHLMSTSTLLDRNECERSHWMLGGGDFRKLPKSSYQWMTKPRHKGFGQFVVPFGKLLSFDRKRAWGTKHLEKSGGLRDALNLYCQDLNGLKLGDPGKDYAAKLMPKPIWEHDLDIHPMAIVKAGSELYVAGLALRDYSGKPDDLRTKQGILRVYDALKGTELAKYKLASSPVFDGMALAGGKLYISTADGSLVSFSQL